ncbi:hypothetical protein L9F63_000938, partial [Diploptera punctata]
ELYDYAQTPFPFPIRALSHLIQNSYSFRFRNLNMNYGSIEIFTECARRHCCKSLNTARESFAAFYRYIAIFQFSTL